MNEPREGFPHVILVVDDDAECGATLELALQQVPGTVVKLTTSAEGALVLLENEIYQVCAVVTDLHLPKMTGLEMIANIRRQACFRDLPIVVVSAAADPSIPEQTLNLGATAFFAKPFSPSAVRQRLRQLLEHVPIPAREETKHA